jgi:hypothetical protein
MLLKHYSLVACCLGLCLAPHALAKTVFINEVFASNATRTYGDNETPDWVELYNSSPYDVDLSGMSLGTDPTGSHRWIFPQGSDIRANGYRVVFFNENKPAVSYNTGFNLSAKGDAVYLFDSALNAVDAVVFGIQLEDLAIGRQQHDTDDWVLVEPTFEGPNRPVATGDTRNLRLNEWMADPADGGDWFEIYNADTRPVALGGLYLTNSLKKNPKKHRIAPYSFIGNTSHAYQKFIADDDTAAGANHVNFKLDKSGDEIGIFPEIGAAIDSVTFLAQATGISEGRLPDASATIVRFTTTPTPEASNYLPMSNLFINEVLTHTDPPMQDSVELYNATLTPTNISGWYLSDSASNFKKYVFPPGSIVPARGYFVTTEEQWTNTAFPFYFNSSEGDWVFLSAANAGNLTGYRCQIKFGPAPNGVSFGRYTNSMSAIHYPLQTQLTLGTNNSGPRVGPVVISEIMYYPPPFLGTTNDNIVDEYVELHNVTTTNVPLFSLTEPTNAWRIVGDITYQFPTNLTLSAGGYLLLVSFDPDGNQGTNAYFRQKYNLSTNVLLLGPYSGRLANYGSSLMLEVPDKIQGRVSINAGYIPFYTLDQIDYLSIPPWPSAASATGFSIQRRDVFLYGNEPTNWFAGTPTPGSASPAGVTDHDHDGLPDDWELTYGLNYLDPADANLDSDGDSLSNSQEYVCGTNPRDPLSALRLKSVTVNHEGTILQFNTEPGRTYTIQYRSSVTDSAWQTLKQISAPPGGGLTSVTDNIPNDLGTRFYRVLVP